MQLRIGLLVVLLAAAASNAASPKDAKCGNIRELELLRQESYALPTEHQWVARITYENGHESKLPHDGCLGVLISKRNVLAPAHCFLLYDGHADAYSVQLGVWNKSSNANKVSCEKDGYCVLPGQDIPLESIAIHPEYDPLTLKSSLAVLKLQRDARLTPNVMPICMPPKSLANETLVGQLFLAAGLPIDNDLKHKTWINTISRPYCRSNAGALVTTSTTVCGYQDQNTIYYLGAPVVGVQVRWEQPQNYYLVGLQLDARNVDSLDRVVTSFLDVRPYLNFINRNAEGLIELD